MAELREGESIEIEGNKGRRYFLSKRRGLYSCTCVSWKRSPDSLQDRSCKHLDQFSDDDDDEDYIVEARKVAALRAAGKRVPLDTLQTGRQTTSNHPQVIDDPAAIEKVIDQLAQSRRLWLDTEVADWKFGMPRLSLIQAMPIESECCSGNVVVMDVLHYPELIEVFEQKIMGESSIEKVFHNASYDLQFLSNSGVESVYCTKETASQLQSRHRSLPQSVSLKALAEHFRLTDDADKTEQKGDWSVRPLSMQQVEYAISDIVYLRGIHLGLQQLMGSSDATLVQREQKMPRMSWARRDAMNYQSYQFDTEEIAYNSQLLQNVKGSPKLPTDAHLTWYLLSQKGATVAEVVKIRGGELKVYNHLAAAILHGKKVDIRAIVNHIDEKTLWKIWQTLPSKNRTPKGLQEASGLLLPKGVFKCIVALFNEAESIGAGATPEPEASVSPASTKIPVLPRRIGNVGPLQRSPRISARAAIRLTDEQLRVLDSFKEQRSLKIHAFAGAGKTQTLVEIGNSTTRKGLYLSFNKKNAAEASKRFPSQVDCMTTHGLAFRSMRRTFSDEKLTQAITVSAIKDALNPSAMIGNRRWTSFEIATLTLSMLRDWLRTSEESFDNASLPAAMVLSACTDAEKDEIRDLCRRLADRCWQLMKSDADSIPLSHDGYLKLWALTQPVIKTDFILLDEAQDSNAIILDVIARQSCQKIMVGDRHQQIYEWRGAVDAMTRLSADEELFLTQTFRFGDEIASYANAALLRLNEPRTLRAVGASTQKAAATAHKAFLARTNAKVIVELMSLQDEGLMVQIQGGTQEMERLVRGIGDVRDGRPSDVAELVGIASWNELTTAVRLDVQCELAVMVNLVGKFGVDKLLKCLRETVGEDDSPDIVLSTVHKAKGLEWDCVELSPDLMKNLPETNWNTTRLDPSELRLLYVAVTRARTKLVLPMVIQQFLAVN